MKKIILHLSILLFFSRLFSQEIVGLDMRIERLPQDLDGHRYIYVDFYLKSQDTVEMDSFRVYCINPAFYYVLEKIEHNFYANDLQMLKYRDTLHCFSNSSNIIGTDTLDLPELENVNGFIFGAYQQFYISHLYWTNSPSDPVPKLVHFRKLLLKTVLYISMLLV